MSDVTAKMAPHMVELIDKLLEPYSGVKRQKAEAAVTKVRKSGESGNWDYWVRRYTDAVNEAVK